MKNTYRFVGDKYGRLTVIDRDRSVPAGKGRYWKCRCDCGNIVSRPTRILLDKSRHNQSCGCAQKDSIRKAHAAAIKVTTKYRGPYKNQLKWKIGNMMKRCYDPKDKRYHCYGGRGITICKEWLEDHTSFFLWSIENGYSPGLTIERIDNDGNYCPENCTFIPMAQQAGNTRKNRFLIWKGERKTVSEWARCLGVKPQAIQHRVDRDWTTERIFSQPVKQR